MIDGRYRQLLRIALSRALSLDDRGAFLKHLQSSIPPTIPQYHLILHIFTHAEPTRHDLFVRSRTLCYGRLVEHIRREFLSYAISNTTGDALLPSRFVLHLFADLHVDFKEFRYTSV